MIDHIQHIFNQSIDVKQQIVNDSALLEKVSKTIDIVTQALRSGNTIRFCGNGGSAADAQHLSAELTGRFYKDRKPLPSEALHANTSYLTAVANDYGYQFVYARLLEGVGKPGDVLISLSTSGNSQNIILAMEKAKEMGIHNVAMTGATGGAMKALADILINVPSMDTPRIQESHMMVGHVICQMVEANLF